MKISTSTIRFVNSSFLLLLISLISSNVNGSDLAVTFNVSKYQNGNNISCHGATDGMVEAVIVGGTSPYTYSWNTGSFNRVLTGLGAGTYVFTVTDANSQTVNATIELIEPKLLDLKLYPEIYGGYNISSQGGDDGSISTEVTGGSQSYSFSWSNGGTQPNIKGLVAGTYSVVVTDANGCTISKSKTLTEPTPLHVVSITSPLHHGYNVSCYRGSDGQIDLTVTGGVPPYKYGWNTGSFEEDISGLVAGEYMVKITDSNEAGVLATITLTQPVNSLKLLLTPQVYANGFNLSCHDCANGSLTAVGSGGVSPYTYLWPAGQTTSTISGLQAIDYKCFITDANGCTNSEAFVLRAPDRDDWSMNGNANIDPATQFMGTTDNKDFVIRTNNAERIRVANNGNVNIHGVIHLDSTGVDSVKAVYVDQSGNLKVASSGSLADCNKPSYVFYKNSCASDPRYFMFGGNNPDVKLLIGDPSTTTPGNYRMYVTGGILTEKLRVADPTTSYWADYVFEDNYKLLSLMDLKKFIEENNHLPNIPSADEVKKTGIDIAEIQGKLLEKIEELTLHVIAQEEKIQQLEVEVRRKK